MVEQLQASDQWSYYQAKGIKATVLEMEGDLLTRLGRAGPVPPGTSTGENAARYRQEQEAIKAKAADETRASQRHLEQHEILSRSVTLLQVSIAVIAISVLTRRRHFLWLSVALGGARRLFHGGRADLSPAFGGSIIAGRRRVIGHRGRIITRRGTLVIDRIGLGVHHLLRRRGVNDLLLRIIGLRFIDRRMLDGRGPGRWRSGRRR